MQAKNAKAQDEIDHKSEESEEVKGKDQKHGDNPYYTALIGIGEKHAEKEADVANVDEGKEDVEADAPTEKAPISLFQISLKSLINLESIEALPVGEAKQWCSFFMFASEDTVRPIVEAKTIRNDLGFKLATAKVAEERVAEKIRIRESIVSSWEGDIERLDPILTEFADGEQTMRSEVEMAAGPSREAAFAIVKEVHDAQQGVIDMIEAMRDRRRFAVKHQVLEIDHLKQQQLEDVKNRRLDEEAVEIAQVKLEQSQKKIQQIKEHCKNLDWQSHLGLRHDW